MKKFYAILCIAIASLTQLQAQVPQGFNYQATVRNSAGDLIVNTNVYFKFNIIQGSQTAVPIFTETHYVTTDNLGQVNLIIGGGTANTGIFSELDWSLGSYYLGIELDTGNGYVAMGTTQLLSVPFALYAVNSGNSPLTTPNLQEVLTENNSANNQQIKDLQDPTEAQDVVTKNYVDVEIENNQQNFEQVLTQGNIANGIQLKGLANPTEDQDAVTMFFLMEKISELQNQIDNLQFASGSGTVTDQDDNTYDYITYGNQVWTLENAATETYRDGTPIPQVTDNSEWQNLTTGAWCYYNNDPTKGKLYNWYAVAGIHDNDESTPDKEFAPEGWHVPSSDEWQTLTEFLIANGYNYDETTTGNKIAKSIASTSGWNSSTSEGSPGNDQSSNNRSGFNIFPEGYRNGSDGLFTQEGNLGVVLSSSQYTSYFISNYSRIFYDSYSPLNTGLMVRFVKGIHPNDIDNDNDNYTENQGDCDDSDGSVYPEAEDLIDGIDNNCDGVIDEQRDNISNLLTGASTNDDIGNSKTWYWQSDTDGFLGVGPAFSSSESSNPIYWSIQANGMNCMYANEFVFTRTSGGVTFEQSGPVRLSQESADEFGVTPDNCYDESVVASIGGIKNVTFLASTSQAALRGSYGDTDFTKASMLFSDNGFLGYYVGHNLAQIEYEIILITENELVVRFVDADSELAWYSRFQTVNPMTIDDDGDGYTENQGDCDDTNAQVYPGATEICDGIDNNCDGEVDEELLIMYYPDNDSDGFGGYPGILTCDPPSGYVQQFGDCDDDNPNINPTVTEAEDGIDNNCDGEVDEGFYSGSVVDVDGNSYSYLTYGDLQWTIKSAEMVTYRDGTPIPQVTDPSEWGDLTTGAWCYYDNDPTKGKLYNWYAAAGIHDDDDTTPNKELAPQGWHVPTDSEWTDLENHLIANGYNYDGSTSGNKIGKAIASTTGWNTSSIVGTPGYSSNTNNSSELNMIPSGWRSINGMFYEENTSIGFWSSSSTGLTNAWYRVLKYDDFGLGRGWNTASKGDGFQIRMVRD
jgi:uncharacterized protein (TIGR02145 family)